MIKEEAIKILENIKRDAERMEVSKNIPITKTLVRDLKTSAQCQIDILNS